MPTGCLKRNRELSLWTKLLEKQSGKLMSQFQLLLQATRARTLPIMLAPVLIGSVLAWQQGMPFRWGLFVLALLGALSAHLGANVVNDVFDFAEGTDQAAQSMVPEGTTLATRSH